MNRQVCKYSIISFQPYVETEEFANIGIVLYVPTTRELHFKLLSSKEHQRITDFFKPLKKESYTNVIHIIKAELEHIQINSLQSMTIDLYDELIRPREDIIQYSKNRVLFSYDVQKTVADLFEHYVKRSFAYKENYEEQMKKRIKLLLTNSQLDEYFKDSYLGDDAKYRVHLPFVNNQHLAAIKPIHFKHTDSNQIIEHGLHWLAKITQLKRYGFIEPQNILFTYAAPIIEQSKLLNAFNEIKSQIEETGILMADINEADTITRIATKFAQSL
jgi:hypothetical protein